MGWVIHIKNADTSGSYQRVPGEFKNKTEVRRCIDNLRSRGISVWDFTKEWRGPRVRLQLRTPEGFDIWRGY